MTMGTAPIKVLHYYYYYFMCADGFLCGGGGGPWETGEAGDRSEEPRLRVVMETAVCHHQGVGERKLCLPLGKVSDESVHRIESAHAESAHAY